MASRFPEIICRELGFSAGVWVSPVYETFLLISLALVAGRLCSKKNLAGFILAMAAITFSWRVVVPWIESTPVFVSASERNVFRAIVSEILASTEQVVRPLCIKPVRHEEVDMVFSAVPVRDDDGVATAIYWVFYEARTREQVDLL